jgi:hypothetical protein
VKCSTVEESERKSAAIRINLDQDRQPTGADVWKANLAVNCGKERIMRLTVDQYEIRWDSSQR